jgi:hypothetical protein
MEHHFQASRLRTRLIQQNRLISPNEDSGTEYSEEARSRAVLKTTRVVSDAETKKHVTI